MLPLIKYYRVTDNFDAVRAWALTLGNLAQYIQTPGDTLVAIQLAPGVDQTWPRFEAEFAGSIEEITE